MPRTTASNNTHNQTGLLLMQLLEGLQKPASYEQIMVCMEKAIKEPLDPEMRHIINATLQSGVDMGFIHKRGNFFYVKPLTHDATIQMATNKATAPSRIAVNRRVKSTKSRICGGKSRQSIKNKRIRKKAKPKATAKPTRTRTVLNVAKAKTKCSKKSLQNLCFYCGHRHAKGLPSRNRSKNSKKATPSSSPRNSMTSEITQPENNI